MLLMFNDFPVVVAAVVVVMVTIQTFKLSTTLITTKWLSLLKTESIKIRAEVIKNIFDLVDCLLM
jgi:hypothetical protein